MNDTRITDAAVSALAKLDSSEALYVLRTNMTIEGVSELKELRPGCRIYYRSDRDPE